MADTIQQIQKALEAAGVCFIPDDDRAGPGVRFNENAD
jgi:hypothetical protein